MSSNKIDKTAEHELARLEIYSLGQFQTISQTFEMGGNKFMRTSEKTLD